MTRAVLDVYAALIGLVVGSFLNAVIHRVPRGQSLVRPGSRCPWCGSPIRVRDNLPLLSFLLLRGRCRQCSAPIAWRYPLVELVTAAAFVGLFAMGGRAVGHPGNEPTRPLSGSRNPRRRIWRL